MDEIEIHLDQDQYSSDGNCPDCLTPHNDRDGGYDIDDIHYPLYCNEEKGGNSNGDYHNWDEVHRCEECGLIYWFKSGAY